MTFTRLTVICKLLLKRRNGSLIERRIVIAGTGSGVGKTTLTIGLMSALKKLGLNRTGI